MATGLQIEELTRDLASGKPKNQRSAIGTALTNLGGNLGNLKSSKTLLDTVIADASAASKPDYGLEQMQADWGSNLVAAVNGWSYSGKSGLNALAQLLADLSEQAGLEGGANRIRLFKGQPGSEAIIAVSQDA